MTTLVPLIDTFRGGTLECQHFGAVAVVDTAGRLVAHAGDPHWVAFTRSTLKALQALPFVKAGGPAHFGFTQEQVALMCASHSGEPMHVHAVDGMLQRQAQPPGAAVRLPCADTSPSSASAPAPGRGL